MKAWIENGRVRDMAADEALATFVPEVAALFTTDVPEGTRVGSVLVDGAWVNAAPPPSSIPPAPGPVVAPDVIVGPIEFKLLFLPTERVAMKKARATDPVVDDFFELIEDPRLVEVNLSLPSTAMAINYMVSKGYVAPSRVAEILSGKFQ